MVSLAGLLVDILLPERSPESEKGIYVYLHVYLSTCTALKSFQNSSHLIQIIGCDNQWSPGYNSIFFSYVKIPQEVW